MRSDSTLPSPYLSHYISGCAYPAPKSFSDLIYSFLKNLNSALIFCTTHPGEDTVVATTDIGTKVMYTGRNSSSTAGEHNV